MADLNRLKAQIDAGVSFISTGSTVVGNEERKALIKACDQLKGVLESPVDITHKLALATHQSTAVRVAMDMGLFNVMTMAKEPSISLEFLVASTGADRLLIVRIMRILTAMRIFEETGENSYSFFPIAKAFVDGSPMGDILKYFHDVQGSVLVKLPEYLVKNGFRNPSHASAGPFQYAFGTHLHHFDWLKQNPTQLKGFNSMQTAQRLEKGEDWFTYFPVEVKLGYNQSPDATSPFLVDIGGGLGTDLTAFAAYFPHIVGRLILQDLPEIISSCPDLGSRINVMAHDCFTPQPIKGARIYYLRTILHDWPDKEAQAILKNILPAMTSGSTLLVNEYVLSDSEVPLFPGLLDLAMMTSFSSLERTRTQWEDLLYSAGFIILKIWTPRVMDVGHASLIEARPRHYSSS